MSICPHRVLLDISLYRQLVGDIYSFKKIPMEESELEDMVLDNWRLELFFDVSHNNSISSSSGYLVPIKQLEFLWIHS